MSKAASDSVADVDVSMMLFEPYGDFTEAEQAMLKALKANGGPALAVINKTDTLKNEADLEIRRRQLSELGVFDQVLATSVREDKGCKELFDVLARYAVDGDEALFASFSFYFDKTFIKIKVGQLEGCLLYTSLINIGKDIPDIGKKAANFMKFAAFLL